MRRFYIDAITLALQISNADRAIELAHQALQRFTGDTQVDLNLLLGKAYNQKFMPDRALKVFPKDAAAESTSNDVLTEIWFEIGKAYVLQHDLPNAAIAYLRATEYSPHQPVLHFAYGTVLRSMQLQDDANDAIKRALDLDPNNSNYLMSYLHGLKQLCDWDELDAILPSLLQRAELDHAPDLHPFSAMLYNFSNAIRCRSTRALCSAPHRPICRHAGDCASAMYRPICSTMHKAHSCSITLSTTTRRASKSLSIRRNRQSHRRPMSFARRSSIGRC
jgi:tetratricopeptide (TPR) repeat protein